MSKKQIKIGKKKLIFPFLFYIVISIRVNYILNLKHFNRKNKIITSNIIYQLYYIII